jgi:hypothetical protein
MFVWIDRLYAVSGQNGKNRALGFTFSVHPESFGQLIATWEPNDVCFICEIRNEIFSIFVLEIWCTTCFSIKC